MNTQEIEIKLWISNLAILEDRLRAMGARLFQPRTHEINLRFDTPHDDLRRSFEVLRLRQDTQTRLTYKGPGTIVDGVRLRREIEFTVGDFTAARALLEALGYHVSVIYEKYRTTYSLGAAQVMLDELPFGNFAEIEGADVKSIHSLVETLAMDWSARLPRSYLSLFERLRALHGFTFRDLTFENFAGMKASLDDLGLRPADLRPRSQQLL